MVAHYVPSYGDIVWVVFDPVKGHEQAGRRPALVISEHEFSKKTSLAVVCPVTSQVKGLPYEVVLSEKQLTKGAVLPIHVKSVDYTARKLQFIEKAPKNITDTVCLYVGTIIGI